MNASLIIIGTELTRGVIQDKHGILVSRELTNMGVHMSQIVALPDDGSVEPVLEALMKKNDIIIITGGLGPTSDDMTRNIIAEAAGVPLLKDPECWQRLVARIGIDRATGANEKQVMIPEGFSVILNDNGTAPGFYGYGRNTLLIALPGPPREMAPMFHESVLPLIRRVLNLPEEARDEYSSFLTAEAKLEELCKEADPELDWGTRFQDYRISLYVSGKDKAARDLAISRIREKVGIRRLEEGDSTALSMAVDALLTKSATVACAESCSGGMAAALLTALPGSSRYMMGSVTSYATEVKRNVLGVSDEIIEKYGVVSGECAEKMAEGVLSLIGSDYAFSITGVAGPDLQEGKEVGTVCFGFAGKGRKSEKAEIRLKSWGRESVRKRGTVAALLLLAAYIDGEDVKSVAESWKVF